MKKLALTLILLAATAPASANDWEKFYTPLPTGPVQPIPSASPPERINSQGNIDRDIESMWRQGFAPIGYTSFNSPNDKIKDAERFAKKLHARYYIALTELTSSSTAVMPLTLPNTTTSVTRGNISASGSGGYASGTYSGTTTTYGSETTYIPFTVSRFDKFAVYFAEAPRVGTGIFIRELTPDEIARYETRRAFVVRFVRDGSPAYQADMLPGDVVTHVNGLPADEVNWQAALKSNAPMNVKLFRNGQVRELPLTVPPEWRPQ